MKLILGDCLEEMAKLPDGSIDAVICDPPYQTTACKWDIKIPLEPMWEQLKRITKKNGAIVLFGSQPFTSALVMSNPKMFKYEWVWDKGNCTGFMNAKRQPLKQCENILVFGNVISYFPQMETLQDGDYRIRKNRKRNSIVDVYNSKTQDEIIEYKNVRYPKNLIYFPSNMKNINRFHPTQKPVALMEYLIKTYTSENEVVLDFCIGSGTTAIAAINTNRRCIGIEKDEQYYEVAKKRIQEAQQKLFGTLEK